MKKKKTKSTKPSPEEESPTSQASAENLSELKSLVREHSVFFDKLVDLIPARFYLPVSSDDKPWFHGLSKSARASAKKRTRENIKKSRRHRLDPDNPSTTLHLLKQTLQSDQPTPNPDPNLSENRSVTYEQLRQKLHRRLEQLRGNRPLKSDLENRKSPPKRKREHESKPDSDTAPVAAEELSVREEELRFNQVRIGEENVNKKKTKKRRLSKTKELEAAQKLAEARRTDAAVSKKHSWKAAVDRASGVKVHDDPRVLKKSIKKEKKRREKNADKWKERVGSREKAKAEKQKVRSGNIAERIHQKKMRKIAKREKKLMRPGFEGRKEGFINDS